MIDSAQRKLTLIDLIMHIQDEALLTAIEQQAYALVQRTYQRPDPQQGVTTIREEVSLEQIKQEQGTQRMDYARFQALAQEVALNEPIEELLQDLTA